MVACAACVDCAPYCAAAAPFRSSQEHAGGTTFGSSVKLSPSCRQFVRHDSITRCFGSIRFILHADSSSAEPNSDLGGDPVCAFSWARAHL